uniref:Uncharacterized protein n=1 Tax=Chlorocebus sabaeus TaxID=60711 RepID=A0A0D9RXK9_CHLSB
AALFRAMWLWWEGEFPRRRLTVTLSRQKSQCPSHPCLSDLHAFLFYSSLFGDVANNGHLNKMDAAVKRIGFCPGLRVCDLSRTDQYITGAE